MLKKSSQISIILMVSLFAADVAAFPCFITMIKGKCWKNYTLSVDVIDSVENKVLMRMNVPKGKAWVRQPFDAKPKQRFILQATYSPSFWATDKNIKYHAKRYWALPETLASGVIAWNVDVCFPDNFSGVPMPPDAGQDCSCDKNSIPVLTQDDVDASK
jgi:hypothetical protein